MMAAPLAGAQQADVQVIMAVSGTCEEATFCFDVRQGDVASIQEGDEVELTLENRQGNPHNVHVTEADNADVGGDTSAEDAFASTETIGENEEDTITFTAPADGDALYFWCDVGSHEASGLYLQAQAQDGGGDDAVDGGEDGNGAPGPGTLAVLAATVLAFALARRR